MTSNSRHLIIEKTLEFLTDEPLEKTLRDQISQSTLTQDERLVVFDEILAELQGYGPIKGLLEDVSVSEILIDAYDSVHFEKAGVLEVSPFCFASPITFNRFVKTLLLEMDRSADQRHPLVDGSLLSGARVHIALPPVTANPVVSIRKHERTKWSLQKLIDSEVLSSQTAEKLKAALREKKNILICGPTGAGKTTLLRALLTEALACERIIIVEDTAELNLDRSNTVSLLTRPSLEGLFPAITLGELLRNALRMRPDRIVVGEIRSEEALVFLDAVSTGHAGSMSSIHGNSAAQALGRLEQLASRAAPQWSIEAIRKLVFEGIDLVVCIERKNGSRQIHEIVELAGLESFGYLLNPWTT